MWICFLSICLLIFSRVESFIWILYNFIFYTSASFAWFVEYFRLNDSNCILQIKPQKALTRISLHLSTVHCEEWKTGYGSIFPVGHRNEPECDDFEPPWAGTALEQRNPRGRRQWGGWAKEEKVQADGGDRGGEEVLFQVRLQAHWCWHHRHLCQGRVSFHFRCGERDLLGGVHNVRRRQLVCVNGCHPGLYIRNCWSCATSVLADWCSWDMQQASVKKQNKLQKKWSVTTCEYGNVVIIGSSYKFTKCWQDLSLNTNTEIYCKKAEDCVACWSFTYTANICHPAIWTQDTTTNHLAWIPAVLTTSYHPANTDS